MPLQPRHLLTCLLALGLPSTGSAQSTAELQQEAEGRAKAGGNLLWRAQSPLSWNDFRGRPRFAHSTAAETSSDVTYLIGCHGRETRFVVLATFSTTESWVRPDIPGDSTANAVTLRHEQTHFDLAELFARELRRALAAAASGLCPDHLPVARQLFDSLSSASKRLHGRYDEETAHGLRFDSQAAWSRRVRVLLDSLADYSGAGPAPT